MRHLMMISRRPERAQTTFCSTVTSDYQALLCFLIQVIETVFPTLADSKTPTQTGT